MKRSESMERMLAEHRQKMEEDAQYKASYLCAHRELLCWLMEQEERIQGEVDPFNGLDGPEAAAKAELMAEYRKRLRVLKNKYCIE